MLSLSTRLSLQTLRPLACFRAHVPVLKPYTLASTPQLGPAFRAAYLHSKAASWPKQRPTRGPRWIPMVSREAQKRFRFCRRWGAGKIGSWSLRRGRAICFCARAARKSWKKKRVLLGRGLKLLFFHHHSSTDAFFWDWPTTMTEHIITHSGTFHADEALAVNLLRKLPRFASAPLTRTRDAATIDKGTIVVDVGATYDAAAHRYDHHQRGFDEVFDDKHATKLSSAGLVWKHFGREIVAAHLNLGDRDRETVELLYHKLYDDFVEAIDGIDNGIAQYPNELKPKYKSRTDLSARVGYLNPRWNEKSTDAELDARFERASAMAGKEFFDRLDYTFNAWLPARQIVVDALAKRTHPQLLVFDQFASWKDHLFTLEQELNIAPTERAIYVVYPGRVGQVARAGRTRECGELHLAQGSAGAVARDSGRSAVAAHGHPGVYLCAPEWVHWWQRHARGGAQDGQ
ncbi:hypothetical protein L1887_45985 [Cichorium endivia]|nr:hypothetical protein L1887_45985 [Cichorium endivia]